MARKKAVDMVESSKPMITSSDTQIRTETQHVRAYTKRVRPALKEQQIFDISSIIDDMAKVNQQLLVNDGDPTMYGTANPFQYNLYSDLIVNPCSISVSEFQKIVDTQPVVYSMLTMMGNLIRNEMGEYYHKNPKYKDFIHQMFNNMSRTMDELIQDIWTFAWAGFYVGEKKYISDGRYIYIKDIVPLPAQSILYRVDSQGQLKDDGIIQYYFNNLWTGYGNLLSFDQLSPGRAPRPNPYAPLGDFNYPWRTIWAQPIGTVIIPKDKCLHIAYKGMDALDSPYGKSLIRTVYDSYLLRTEMNRITRNAANFKAAQTPVVVIDPGQQNTAEGESAFEQVGNTLENLGSSGGDNPAVLLQGRLNESVWVTHLDSTANLDEFVNLNKYYDGQQLLACLGHADLMGLSDKGSYALGETQADLFGRNITALTNLIKGALIQQVVQPVLEVNFNEREDFGTFAKSDNIAEDVALNMDKINLLHSIGKTIEDDYLAQMMDMPNAKFVDLPSSDPTMSQSATNPNNNGVGTNFRRASR